MFRTRLDMYPNTFLGSKTFRKTRTTMGERTLGPTYISSRTLEARATNISRSNLCTFPATITRLIAKGSTYSDKRINIEDANPAKPSERRRGERTTTEASRPTRRHHQTDELSAVLSSIKHSRTRTRALPKKKNLTGAR